MIRGRATELRKAFGESLRSALLLLRLLLKYSLINNYSLMSFFFGGDAFSDICSQMSFVIYSSYFHARLASSM